MSFAHNDYSIITAMVPCLICNVCLYFYRIGPMIALILIGLGTGGIKPCVAAFGADQFRLNQVSFFNSFLR